MNIQPLIFVKLAALVFILVGGWLLYATIGYVATRRAFQTEGVQTEARVVEAHTQRTGSRSRRYVYHLTVSWTDTAGARRTLSRKVPGHVYFRVAQFDGTIIAPRSTILYVPSKPMIAPVMGFEDPGMPGGPLIGAMVALATGLVIAWFAWTPTRRRRGIIAILAGE
jgi:hypothetical protein